MLAPSSWLIWIDKLNKILSASQGTGFDPSQFLCIQASFITKLRVCRAFEIHVFDQHIERA
jgi:hypothetical protein